MNATIEARVFPSDASDDECLLAEIQENNARKELTGAERKAFAAEVGRLITEIFKNSQTENNSRREFDWFREFKEKSGIGQNTAYTWWSAFCAETGLSITPKQATAENRSAFFDWLERHKAEEEDERQRKAEEAAAEKARKYAEAYEQQKQKAKATLLKNLSSDAKEWGVECVMAWFKEWIDAEAKNFMN